VFEREKISKKEALLVETAKSEESEKQLHFLLFILLLLYYLEAQQSFKSIKQP